jgi:hypothetical protein
MPHVELTRDEARTGDLPFVCMVCGQAGHVYRPTVLSYCPWWVYLGIPLGILPYFLLALFFNRRARLRAPLCELHQYHWLWRSAVLCAWFALAGFLMVAGLVTMLMAASTMAPSQYEFIEWLPVLLMNAGLAGLLVLLPLLALLLKHAGIHASPITPLSITLAPVADEFAEALRVHRQDRHPNLDRAFCEG